MQTNFLNFVPSISQQLSHPVAGAVLGRTWSSAAALHSAMVAEAKRLRDEDLARYGQSLGYSVWELEGNTLRHTTGSGRARFEVSELELRLSLFSPSFMGGTIAFATLVVNRQGTALDMRADEDFYFAGNGRLAHIISTMKLLSGRSRWIAALPRRERRIVLRYTKEHAIGVVQYYSNPENLGTLNPEVARGYVAQAQAELAELAQIA